MNHKKNTRVVNIKKNTIKILHETSFHTMNDWKTKTLIYKMDDKRHHLKKLTFLTEVLVTAI